MRTEGYVGSIEVETEGHDRVWFSLTTEDTGANWVEVRSGVRSWFQMSVERNDSRPVQLAKLALLFDSMREGWQVAVHHPSTPRDDIHHMRDDDTYDADRIRSLRSGIHF